MDFLACEIAVPNSQTFFNFFLQRSSLLILNFHLFGSQTDFDLFFEVEIFNLFPFRDVQFEIHVHPEPFDVEGH